MRILFVHNQRTTWVQKDLDILASKYEVREIYFKRRIRNIIEMARGVLWAELVFCWLGNSAAFVAMVFAKLFQKESIVIAGGDDVVDLPEIKYGAMRKESKNSLRRLMCRFVFKHANKVLAVSQATAKDAINNAGVTPQKLFVVYHGFESNSCQPKIKGKNNLVITVGAVTRDHLIRKGLKAFVKSARYLPNVPFVLIGEWRDNAIDLLREFAGDNVKFTGFVSQSELERYMREAKVYVQVSAQEGFGSSLAEAMLSECIPVVTDRYAIREVVGDCGIYVPYGDSEAIARAIQRALSDNKGLGKDARKRIEILFPLEKRKKELLRHVEEVAYVRTEGLLT